MYEDRGMTVPMNNGHPSQIVDYIKQCFHTNSFSDMSFISCDGATVPAHRILISSASKNLRSLLLTQSVEDPPAIVLPDFDSKTIRSLVSIVSSGVVAISDAEVAEKVKELAALLAIEAKLQLKNIDSSRAEESMEHEDSREKSSLSSYNSSNEEDDDDETQKMMVEKDDCDGDHAESSKDRLLKNACPSVRNCPNCGKTFSLDQYENRHSYVSGYNNHKNQCKGPESESKKKRREYSKILPDVRNCLKCDKAFSVDQFKTRDSWINSYSKHMRRCKGTKGPKIFVCGFCGKSFPRKANFQVHIGPCSLPKVCFECDREFQSNYKLRNHICKGPKKTQVRSIDVKQFLFT